MKQFVVSYSISHDHIVEVGIKASSSQAAIRKAKKYFDDGSLWDNTSDMPLLRDEMSEVDNGSTLEFDATEVKEFPQPDVTAQGLLMEVAARELVRGIACRQVNKLADIINKAKEIAGHETGLWQPDESVFPKDMPSFAVFSRKDLGMRRYPHIPADKWVRYRPGDIEDPTFLD